tara:strand:+ start:79 stop:363 length:285 start_codon:yes stop_codon:yes gene_type:complete
MQAAQQQIAAFCAQTDSEQNCLANAQGLFDRCGVCLQDPTDKKCTTSFDTTEMGMGKWFGSAADGQHTCQSLLAATMPAMPQETQQEIQKTLGQ